MVTKFCNWARRHSLAFAVALGVVGSSAFADVSPTVNLAPFNTAMSQFEADLGSLIGVMAPALVTIAGITLIMVAVSWLVRKVRGAIGRG